MRILCRPVIMMTMAAGIAFPVAHAVTKTTRARQATSTAQVDLIGSPNWAAFVADRRTSQAGQQLFSRYFQNSHGSQRTEAYSPDKSQRTVTIHNLDRRMSYFQGPKGDWAMLPLIAKFRDRPRRIPIGTGGLAAVSEKRLGVTVYEYISPDSGVRSLLAPDLNLFTLFSDNGTSQEEVISLRLEEPDASLFYPPEVANVRMAKNIADLLRPFPNEDK